MFSQSRLSLVAMMLTGFAIARVDPPGDGSISACHGQQCDDCPITASVNGGGYPNCVVYPSDGNLKGYEAESGNGYDVWWNSGDPNPGCKIIVRTPASTDLPACGYFLTSWAQGGCYYTSIQQTFMLQYCCGSGDCDAASPSKRSVDDVHAAHLQGITSSTALVLDALNSTAEGVLDLGSVGEVRYRRTPSSLTHKAQAARAAENEARACKDTFDLSDTYTKGGDQIKVSPTQNCNIQGGCSIEISSSVTTGYSVSFTFGVNIEIIEASTSVSFSKEETHSISNTYSQSQGTYGYVSFIPTYTCYRGSYHSCKNGDSDGDACNPKMIGEGDSATPDGTYSFVYVQAN